MHAFRGPQGNLGARFPGCLEAIMLGREREGADEQKRDAAIVRTIMKKLFVALKRLHSLGARHAGTRPPGLPLCRVCKGRCAAPIVLCASLACRAG